MQPSSFGAAGEALLRIDAPSQAITVGTVVTVDLVISTSVASRSSEFGLRFDPAVLQCASFAEGGFYRDWADANGALSLVLPTRPRCNNATGVLSTTGIALIGGEGGPAGSGVLASLAFTATHDGVSTITIVNPVVNDDTITPQPIALSVTLIHARAIVGKGLRQLLPVIYR